MTSDLYSPALDVERADGEVDPDGVLLPLGELARLEALHQAGLAHVGVSDEDDLEEEVEGVLLRIHESVERSAGSHSSERELSGQLPSPVPSVSSSRFPSQTGSTGATATCSAALWVM